VLITERSIGDVPSVISQIDRSERVDVEYQMADGQLVQRPVTMSDVPGWNPIGEGEHSLSAIVRFCRERVEQGGRLLVADESDAVLGVAIVHPDYDSDASWLSFMHVSRAHRRHGVASQLWSRAVELAFATGAREMRVSATPTGSAVGFYMSRGCVLADPPDQGLASAEPEDIQFVLHR
jgi:GNAT superfamily N-acetyltransferase